MGAPKVTLSAFIERSNNIHNRKFDYSKVNWVNTRIKVEIICSKHGSFMQKPFKHLQGQGCPDCRKNATVTQEMFIERAKSMHPDDNYDYSKVDYKDMWTLVKIICPKHGEFEQTPAKHIKTGSSGCQGCPKCRYDKQKQTNINRYGVASPMQKKEFRDKQWESINKNGNVKESKPESKMHEILCDIFGNDNIERHYDKDPRYPFRCDFYIKSFDLFIELNANWTHGLHWFDALSSKDVEKLNLWKLKADSKRRNSYTSAIDTWTVRDPLKLETALKNGINYIVFWNNNLSDFYEWINSNFNTSYTI